GPWSRLREPDFTVCLKRGSGSLSVFVNGGLIIFGLPLIWHYATRVPVRHENPGWHFFLKAILALLLVATSTFDLFTRASGGVDGAQFEIGNICLAVRLSSLLVMTVLSLYTHRSANHNSTALLIFWPISITLQLVELRTQILVDQPLFSPKPFWASVIMLMLSCLMFIVEATPKRLETEYLGPDDELDASPEDRANLYSFLTFSWMAGLLELGARKHLVAEDLWGLPKAYQVATVSEAFQQAWGYQRDAALEPSLTWALVHSFGGPFLFAAVLKLVQDAPHRLHRQLWAPHTRQPIYYGVGISVGMFGTALVQTAFLHQYFQLCMVTGMKLRTALVSAIYQKSLRLSGASGQSSSVGEIVNHMSVDAQRLQDLCSYVHVVWSGVFQIVLALLLLYRQVGVSVLAGFGLMLVAIPLNVVFGRRLRGLQQVLLKVKDSRIKLMDELLSGMKVIKLYAWEKSFLSKLFEIRNDQELATLRRYAVLNAGATFTSFSLPLFVSFATFTVYSLIADEPLTAETVFVTLSLLNLLAFPLNMLPYVLTSVVEAAVSVKRIHRFLTAEELDPAAVDRQPLPLDPKVPAIEIHSGSFSWLVERGPTLRDLHLKVKRGELFGVVGRVGAGKSSLLSAILGDMNRLDGQVTVRGSVAYVPQQPWIMNATVRENIIFGRRFDPDFYEKTLLACALTADLDMLISGDQTEIGERGITLSGGQKARISLARAVYARADVYLLDDPLSAVDAHVGRHIFDRVIGNNGILRRRTRVLVTHAVHFLSALDTIAMFEGGRVSELGTYAELKANEASNIHHLLTSKFRAEDEADHEARSHSLSHHELCDDGDDEGAAAMQRMPSHVSLQPTSDRRDRELTGPDPKDKLMTVEESAQGSVSSSVYMAYFKACSLWGFALFVALAFLSQLTSLASMLWLNRWTKTNSDSQVAFNIAVYGVIGLVAGVVTFTQFLVLYIVCGLRAAKATHNQMVMAVVRAPMSFFDTTPLGRIVNRFSKDQSTIDETLPRSFGGYVGTLMRVSFVVLVVSFSTAPFLALVALLGWVYYSIQRYYLATSRELKRLDSVSRSPIFAHFQETLAGAASIRAYQQQPRFVAESEERLEANLRAYYPSVSLNRWLALRHPGRPYLGLGVPMDPAVVGLSVTYALNVTQSLNWCIRQYCEIETNIVSMERIQQYIDIPSEAPYEASASGGVAMGSPEEARRVAAAPSGWPSRGRVEFKGYATRYRPGLDLVLKDLSLEIKPGEKVGIVGRTGAGKSSLTLALFRIVEAAQGCILVDGVDISNLGLFDLRSRLSIIPQDPVLFAGTVRDNLDPFNALPDAELWRALDHVSLKEPVSKLAGNLDAHVAHGGENFSVGQRQLICLARALLRKSSILVLDEATACDRLPHRQPHPGHPPGGFGHCTVLTIAHRINTVLDGDKVLVLDRGRVREFDAPKALLGRPDSLFHGLAKEAGSSEPPPYL
ncbi:hypothetical protein L0F63_003025, partial [Massospora cicadina]